MFTRATSTEIATLSYESGLHSVAYVTVPTEDAAKELARKLLEHKLAACCNVIPGLTSMYESFGKLKERPEILLMIRTRTARVEELSKFVRNNHPYKLPEVITVPIQNGYLPYLELISNTVPEGTV